MREKWDQNLGTGIRSWELEWYAVLKATLQLHCVCIYYNNYDLVYDYDSTTTSSVLLGMPYRRYFGEH